MREVVDAYTETYISRNSCIPIVHLLSNGPKGACPLLSADGRCSVHDCKPTVCALFPLGRVAINRTDDQAPGEGEMPTIKYILNDHSCGSAKKVNTVRSWLAKFGIPEQDEFYLLWNKVRMSLTPHGCQPDTLLIGQKYMRPVSMKKSGKEGRTTSTLHQHRKLRHANLALRSLRLYQRKPVLAAILAVFMPM